MRSRWSLSLVGALTVCLTGCAAGSPSDLLGRIVDADLPGVNRIWLSDDTGHPVFVVMSPTASDEEARRVWCEGVGQAAIDRGANVSVANDDEDGPPPDTCSDSRDLPTPR